MRRKNIRLQDYDYSRPGVYFLTVCTKDRKNPFCDVGDDAHIVPKPYGKIVQKYLCTIPGIDRFVIMPNHIHLIVIIEGTMRASSPTPSIPQIMRSFKTMVTKEIGKPIWQRSYYDHIVRNEADYLKICTYIQNNPLKWKEDRFYTR